jgi:hypothetical protein
MNSLFGFLFQKHLKKNLLQINFFMLSSYFDALKNNFYKIKKIILIYL